MFKNVRKRKKTQGQGTLEFATLSVIVLVALLSIKVYVERAIAGRAKESVDSISDTQFDPEKTTYVKTSSTYSKTNEKSQNGATTSLLLEDETMDTTINMWYE